MLLLPQYAKIRVERARSIYAKGKDARKARRERGRSLDYFQRRVRGDVQTPGGAVMLDALHDEPRAICARPKQHPAEIQPATDSAWERGGAEIECPWIEPTKALAYAAETDCAHWALAEKSKPEPRHKRHVHGYRKVVFCHAHHAVRHRINLGRDGRLNCPNGIPVECGRCGRDLDGTPISVVVIHPIPPEPRRPRHPALGPERDEAGAARFYWAKLSGLLTTETLRSIADAPEPELCHGGGEPPIHNHGFCTGGHEHCNTECQVRGCARRCECECHRPLDLEGPPTGLENVKAGDRLPNGNVVESIERLTERGDWYQVTFDDGTKSPWMWMNQSIQVELDDVVVTRHVKGLAEIAATFEGDRECPYLSAAIFLDGKARYDGDIEKRTGTYHWFRMKVSGDHTYELGGLLVHNADRYWVGGDGNSNDTAHYSGTSGGSGGSSAPTSSDNFITDTLSNASGYTITVNATWNSASFTIAAPLTGNVTWSNASIFTLNIYGSFTLYSGAVWNNVNAITVFAATSTGKTITTAGSTITTGQLQFNGTGGGWTLQDDLVTGSSQNFQVYAGAVDTNGKTLTLSHFIITGSGVGSLTLGASVITTGYVDLTGTNKTLMAGTSAITNTGTVSDLGGRTLYSYTLTPASSVALTGANTFTNLSRTNASGYASLTLSANQTVTGTFTVTGNNASTQRIYVASDTAGTARTITAAAVSLTNVDFEDITGAGAATWSGTLVGGGTMSGCSGITFATPVTAYWVHGGTASVPITTANWFTASGGAVATRVPLMQDTARFDANSFGASGKTVTIGTQYFRIPSIDWTGTANSPTFTLNNGPSFYGSITLVSGLTVGGSGIYVMGRGSYTLTSAGKSFPSTVEFNMPSGTMTFQDAYSAVTDITYLHRGTLNSNGMSVATYAFSSTNANTRALTLGATTWTLTGTSTVWNCTTSTNMTLSAGTSTLTTTGSTFILQLGGKTYNNITVAGSGGGSQILSGNSSVISGTVSVTGTGGATFYFNGTGMSVGSIVFSGGTNVTMGTDVALTVTGDLTLAAGITYASTGAITFTGTGTQAITSAGKTFGHALTQNGSGGTVSMADAFTTTGAYTLTQGTLALGAFDHSAASFSSSNSNTRAITGSGTLTLTGTGTVWNTATITGLTMTGWTGTVKLTDASSSTKTFNTGAIAHYNIWFAGAGTGNFDFVGASIQFNQLRVDGAAHTVRVPNSSAFIGPLYNPSLNLISLVAY